MLARLGDLVLDDFIPRSEQNPQQLNTRAVLLSGTRAALPASTIEGLLSFLVTPDGACELGAPGWKSAAFTSLRGPFTPKLAPHPGFHSNSRHNGFRAVRVYK